MADSYNRMWSAIFRILLEEGMLDEDDLAKWLWRKYDFQNRNEIRQVLDQMIEARMVMKAAGYYSLTKEGRENAKASRLRFTA